MKSKLEGIRDTIFDTIQSILSSTVAKKVGQVEICFNHTYKEKISLEKNDINTSSVSEESIFGIRIIHNGRQGFVMTNSIGKVTDSIEDALKIAKAQTEEDNFLELPEKVAVEKIDLNLYDETQDQVSLEFLGQAVSEFLSIRQSEYPKVNIDSADFSLYRSCYGVLNSKGIQESDLDAGLSASYLGMGVDGEKIGSFDSSGVFSRNPDNFRKELKLDFTEFLERCVFSLRAKTLKPFTGSLLVPPESIFDFLGDFLGSLSGSLIRRGRSKFSEKIGQKIASDTLTIVDQPLGRGLGESRRFDREGLPVQNKNVVENGILKEFFYNHYERKKAKAQFSGGNATGGASGIPSCGPFQIHVKPGSVLLKDMIASEKQIIQIGRFSGNTNTSSGDFSGVIKGGKLKQKNEDYPVKEISISGNLYELLNQIGSVSQETKLLYNSYSLPYLMFDGIQFMGSE